MQVNPGVDPNSIIEFPDPGSGKKVQQRFAKFLEKTLLVRFTQAHGGGTSHSLELVLMSDAEASAGSEWYIVRPAGGLTAQQLGQNLTTLLTSFNTTDLEHHYDTFIQQFETLMHHTAS